MNKDKEIRKLNCAIYTRKSTEEGLDQDFNTLDPAFGEPTTSIKFGYNAQKASLVAVQLVLVEA